MHTKTSFISQVLECPLIILASHHSSPSVYFLRVCTSTPPKHTHAAHYCVLQALSLSGFTSPFSFSSFGARTHTETRTNTQTLPTDCFPIFFFSGREIYGRGNVGDRLLPCPVWTHQSDKVAEVVSATSEGLFARLPHASLLCALACVNPLCSGSALSHAASLKSSTVALCFPAIWPGVKCRMPRREAQIRVAERQVYAATDAEEFGVDTKTFWHVALLLLSVFQCTYIRDQRIKKMLQNSTQNIVKYHCKIYLNKYQVIHLHKKWHNNRCNDKTTEEKRNRCCFCSILHSYACF